MSNQTRSLKITCIRLSGPDEFKEFFESYIAILKEKLKQIKLPNTGDFYTCDEPHNWLNYHWEPFFHLSWFCDSDQLDFSEFKNMIEEHQGQEMVCECRILNYALELRRKELTRISGIDFGERGKRGVDVC
jgi:hypothetical protein